MLPLSPLASRLASLKTKQDAENTGLQSKLTTIPTLLSTYLLIFSKAETECCINYMEGAIALYKYLTTPLAGLDIEANTYPEIDNLNFKVPELLSGYSSLELAKIVSGYRTNNDLTKLNKVTKAILILMYNKVLMELY